MSDSRQKRLDKAQLRVLFQVPFFAPGVAKLPVEFVPEKEYGARFGVDGQLNTACTDGDRLYWCAEWFDTLPDQVLVTLLAHEVCHCLLGHIWRLPPSGGDQGLANEAADHAVNLMLKEFGATVTAKRLADPFPFPADAPGLCDPQYANMSEEAIYAKLASRPQNPKGGNKPGRGQGAGGKGKPGSGQGGSNQNPSNGQPEPFGQFKPKPGASPSQGKKLHNDWQGTLIQSVAAMKGRGDLPAGLERLVDGLVSPQVDWWQILRSWLREQCSDDWNFLEPAMELSDSGFMLPSLKSEKMGPVVFATDTSGSIDQAMLAQFQSEKQACLDEMRPSRLLDIYCDSKVQLVEDYALGDVIKRQCPGGGGTSFAPVWKELQKRGVAPKCLVYLTDLDGDFGDDPGYPVIWIHWTKGGTAPFGEVVYAGR